MPGLVEIFSLKYLVELSFLEILGLFESESAFGRKIKKESENVYSFAKLKYRLWFYSCYNSFSFSRHYFTPFGCYQLKHAPNS